MAISKILCMKDCGGHFHGKHLKQSLEYIMNPEKTQNNRLVGGVNCQPESAFEQMMSTKRNFGKVDKRQGYHMILSFKEGEVSPDTAYEIAERFVAKYLGERFETVFCIHDNTDCVHAHIIFNSVSFLDGSKYRYEKGDWAKDIQPITNRLCEEYGLSTIDIGAEHEPNVSYQEWNEFRDGRFVWNKMISRDVDACILQANTFEEFQKLLNDKGYEVKQGKYLAIKAPGMGRFRRCKSLGDEYTEECIRERIVKEDISFYQSQKQSVEPQIVKCYVKRYRRAKLSGLQKKYYAKLYRIGKLKKRPYSQVYKYRNDIRKMNRLQEQYLFLVRHDIRNVGELTMTVQDLTEKRKTASSEKSRVYRARQKCISLFDILKQMDELEPAEKSFQAGDNFFIEEHEQWTKLKEELATEGYTEDEVRKLKYYYQEQIRVAAENEKMAVKEQNLGRSILKSLATEETTQKITEHIKQRSAEERKVVKQPVR